MSGIEFTSSLDSAYSQALEQLLFFNGNQKKVLDGALSAIEQYGTPKITPRDGRLRITLESGTDVQSLYALRVGSVPPELVGVIVFTRKNAWLEVLFMAVREDYASGEVHAGDRLYLKMIDVVQGIARSLIGVSHIRLLIKRQPIVLLASGIRYPKHR